MIRKAGTKGSAEKLKGLRRPEGKAGIHKIKSRNPERQETRE